QGVGITLRQANDGSIPFGALYCALRSLGEAGSLTRPVLRGGYAPPGTLGSIPRASVSLVRVGFAAPVGRFQKPSHRSRGRLACLRLHPTPTDAHLRKTLPSLGGLGYPLRLLSP